MDLDLLLTDIDDALLAQALEAEGMAPVAQPIPTRGETVSPLSRAQQRLWFLQQLSPEGVAYNSLYVFSLNGEISAERLEAALHLLQQRHQVLASVFRQQAEAVVQQVSEQRVQVQSEDLRPQSAAQQASAAAQLIAAERARPFDLAREAPLRATLIRKDERDALLLLNLHHIVMDAWSVGLFLRDFVACYQAATENRLLQLEPLPIQYGDYAHWQQQTLDDLLAEQLPYWQNYVKDSAFRLDLPTDRPRPAMQSEQGALTTFTLDSALSRAVSDYARGQGISPFPIFMAAWQALLWRYSGQHSFLVGVPNANRNRYELEELIGCFINTQLFRAELAGQQTSQQLILSIADDLVKAQDYQDVPYDLLVEKLDVERDPGFNPLFQIMFNYQSGMASSSEPEAIQLPGAVLQLIDEPPVGAKCDLVLNIHQRESQSTAAAFSGSIEYCTDLFTEYTVSQLIEQYQSLLRAMLASPAQDLRSFSLVDAAQQQALAPFEYTAADYSLSPSWLARFAQQVARQPDATVIRDAQGALSWQQLDHQSDCLAAHLQQQGVGADDVIAILAARDRRFIVALVGILKAGAGWLPLAPDQPAARWQQLLESAAVKAVFTDSASHVDTLARQGIQCPVLDYPALLADIANTPVFRPVAEQPGQLAYVLFTSGSTGKPKGVMISREGMLNNILAKVGPLGLSENDCIAQSAGQCFDISVWQMLAAPVLGCQVVVIGDDQVRDPAQLGSLLTAHNITIAELVPSLIQALLEQPALEPASLRWLLPTGEALPPQLARDWFQRYPAIPLMNAYGPAECADDVAFAPLREAPETDVAHMPIGLPTANARLYVVDDALNRVPAGVIGELAVGGLCVGRGYRQDPLRTAAVFVPDPFGEPGERLYLTGDRVKRRADGQLEYVGRQDFQVKIRGQRIEPGEIEACLEQQPGVRQAVVSAEGGEHLVAWIAGEAMPAEATLRQTLREQLPACMVPSLIVPLAEMPLNNNGKVDRKALPAPDFSQMQGQYEAPQGETEQQLAAIWAQLLGVERIGRDDNFFSLGGHSLLATRLVSQVSRLMNRALPLKNVFEAPVLHALAICIAQAPVADMPALKPLARNGSLPLSFAQQRMWMLEQIEGGENYLMPAAVELSGDLNSTALAQSFNDLIARHEALRTRFISVQGEAQQQIIDSCPFELKQIDLRDQRDAAQQLDQLIRDNASQPFDLAAAPLMRATLVQQTDERWLLLFAMHHIIGDEWSTQLLLQELSRAYDARLQGQAPAWTALSLQYADYAGWQRSWLQGEVLEQQLGYWQDTLAGYPDLLALPTDFPRPARQQFDGHSLRFQLPQPLCERVSAFCQQQDVTQYQLLLAAFQLVLARFSGQAQVVVGVPVANRTRPETEAMVGCFINTLVMGLDTSAAARLIDVVAQVKQRAIEAQSHQELPFEQLVEHLNVPRALSHSPLFQVMFNMQQAVLGDIGLKLTGVNARALTNPDPAAKFDLSLDISEDRGQLAGSLDYCTALFREETMQQLLDSYQHLLLQIVTTPQLPLASLSLLDESRQESLADFEQHAASYDLSPSWLQRFAARVAAQPQAVVIRDAEGTLSWRQLDQQSDRLAAQLQQLGVVPDDVVAILAQRNRQFILALVAILKAGAGWLPLAPNQPAARWQQLLETANVRAVLTDQSGHEQTLRQHQLSLPVLDYRALLASAVSAQEPEFVSPAEHAGQLAYVLFTSGSTGTPKGVMISREGMLNNILAKVEPLGLTAADCIAQSAGQCFDISVWQMLAAPVLGCQVVVFDDDQVRDAAHLGAQLVAQQITIAELVPALMQALLEQHNEALEALRWVMPTGEALPPQLARDWFQRYPAIPLMNAYGPAECADDVAFAPLRESPTADISHMPIGLPTANACLYVVDEALNRVPNGVIGELAVGGIGVGRGYREDPQRTAAVFVPDPFGAAGERLYLTGDLVKRRHDGQLEYVGRRDFQVKIRGQRIEPGEIEACLEGLSQVRQAVVSAEGGQHLVAWVSGDQQIDTALLKQQLGERLPAYMVPALIMVLARMPLSANGKVDRKALPAPDFSQMQADYQPPQGELEQQLAAIWSTLLGIEQVGRHDNFFELGGHSLLATRLISQISQQLRRTLPLKAVFEAPQLCQLAAQLATSEAVSLPPLLPATRSAAMPLSYAQQRLWVVDRMEGGSSAYNMQGQLKITGSLQLAALERAIARLIERHEVLRTNYIAESEEPVQHIQPAGPFSLERLDLRGLEAAALQPQLDQLLMAEGQKPFDLATDLMLRGLVVQLQDDQYLLSLTTHHIASDDWSMQVMVRELCELYSADIEQRDAELTPLPLQYADFAVWQKQCLQGELLGQTQQFWRDYMAGAPECLALPLDFPRPAQRDTAAGRVALQLSASETAALQQLAQRHQTSLFMVLLAGYNLCLHHQYGLDDIVLGTDLAGRTNSQLEELIGFFINVLPVRNRIEPQRKFSDWLAQLRDNSLSVFENQHMPFDLLVETLQPARNNGWQPLVQSLFVMQNVEQAQLSLPGLQLEEVDSAHIDSKFDMSLFISEGDQGLKLSCVYQTALFRRRTLETLMESYRQTLLQLLADPEQPLSSYAVTVPVAEQAAPRTRSRGKGKLGKLKQLKKSPA